MAVLELMGVEGCDQRESPFPARLRVRRRFQADYLGDSIHHPKELETV
jgi:hypothetical protein